METRIQYIFLGLRNAALVALLALTQTNLMAAEQETVEWDEAAELVEPEIKRTKVDIANIDALDVEMGAFFGMMNVVDFGTNPVSGISLAYHVTEDIFVTATVGQSTTDQTSFEVITGARLLTDSERDLLYYDLSVGLNLLPGEGFIGKSYAFNSSFYGIAGIGSTKFAGDQRFTITAGAGYRIIMMDWLALHIEVKNHIFDIDILGTDKTTHNISYKVGFTVFF
ncbi:MAG: outer membrane beta-barrel domain-containing protein [Gammaproteobacteria bacterium]|nr:MAG: outer membrane beta-barrel domain-containing protein [Gammaproteobacteria bacterium]